MRSLPLIRLSTAKPCLIELDRRDLPTDEILMGSGLNRTAFNDPEAFVHALIIYQFFEDAARVAEDQHLLVAIGESMNTANWPPLVEVCEKAKTVADFLTSFAIVATKHSSATEQCLEIRGRKAVLLGRRSFEPSIVPAQIDGFFVGLLVSILRRVIGTQWRPAEVLVVLSEPRVLPPVFHGIKAIRGDRMGYHINFPAEWLSRAFDQPDFLRRSIEDAGRSPPAHTVSSSVKQALRPLVGVAPLTATTAAEACGLHPRTLSRLLSSEHVTLSELITGVKQEFATTQLTDTTASVAEIAAALGYSDPTSFARSFKRWTGVSPREYRHSSKSGSG